MKDVDGLVCWFGASGAASLRFRRIQGPGGKRRSGKAPPPPLPASPCHLSLLSVPPWDRPSKSISAGEASALTARTTFQRLCVGCHGLSGEGSPLRASTSAIPDFTLRTGKRSASDAALTASILEGKGRTMPPFGTRLDATGAVELVTYVRSFAGSRTDQGQGTSHRIQPRFQQLVAEIEALKRDYRGLSNNNPFATSNPSSSTGSAAFSSSSP